VKMPAQNNRCNIAEKKSL